MFCLESMVVRKLPFTQNVHSVLHLQKFNKHLRMYQCSLHKLDKIYRIALNKMYCELVYSLSVQCDVGLIRVCSKCYEVAKCTLLI